jgi:competence protein ComEC
VTRLPAVTAVALAFCAGLAVAGDGLLGAAGLLLVLAALRPRLPFRRPGAVVVMVAASMAAGALHGIAGGDPQGLQDAPGRRAPTPPSSWRQAVQEELSGRIAEIFPEEGAMVDALLLARRQGMDPAVREAFTRTGAAHLLAISGFHVGVLAGWMVVVLRGLRASRRRAALGAAALVWGYVALLGFPTSAVRAGLLLSGAALGRVRGRPVHALGSWGTALLAVALLWPESIGAAGTQLSFAGALGLLLWARSWGEALEARLRWPGRLRPVGRALATTLAASLAAQVATLPLAVWHFQRVAVLGLPATLAATPLVSMALPGALLCLLLGTLGIPGAEVPAQGVEGLLWASRVLLSGMAGLDPGWMLGPASVLGATGAGWITWRTTAAPAIRRWRPGAVAVSMLLAVAWAPGLRTWGAPNALRIHVLDVGQGDAILLQEPGGRWILVDTGPGPGDRLLREMTRLGVRRLELLVLSHPDLDHIGGAEAVLSGLPVGAVLDGGGIRGTAAFAGVAGAASDRGVPWRIVRAGQRWRIGALSVSIHHPSGTEPEDTPPNDLSVIFTATWGDFDALFTGDASMEVERRILPQLGPVELLKVGHHGSRTSTGPALLARVRPEWSVISVGRRNRFRHPAPEVVVRLEGTGGRILRTDRMGRITLVVRRDGSVQVDTQRDPYDD